MESIRILQDTYENLYALTFPIADLLEKEMPNESSGRKICDTFYSMGLFAIEDILDELKKMYYGIL